MFNPRYPGFWLVVATAFCLSCMAGEQARGDAIPIREPAVAGKFYPEEPDRLAQAVQAYLSDALPPAGPPPRVIVAPHAGYVFSAQICADAFNQAAGQDLDLVVLLGVNHTTPGFQGASVYAGGGFRTPLGVAPIDADLAKDLMAADPRITFAPEVHRREHSIEVMVPFVQVLFPHARILPIVVGSDDPDLTGMLGKALAERVRERKFLIVASSDLSHYPAYDDAIQSDRATLDAMAGGDPERFLKAVADREAGRTPKLDTCACGRATVTTAMAAARHLGALFGRIVSYANSGDTVFGDRNQVVGYGAVAYATAALPHGAAPAGFEAAPAPDAPLSAGDRKRLLSLARDTLTRYFDTGTVPLARGGPSLRQRRGAFVTLKKDAHLRGGIGYMGDDIPLCQNVARMAVQAAFQDPRFTPLDRSELDAIDIEISALTPFAQVKGSDQIRVGRDGVLIRKDGRSAVFLPQVATEQGWGRDEMLAQLCLKAGLPEDAWRSETAFFTFQADVFGESDFR